MKTFYIPPTARVGGIKSSTVASSITQNTRTAPFTITIDDYSHRNAQSLKDFYVFFAPISGIPSSINIKENNVTAIDASVNGSVTLTCTGIPINTGNVVVCLAIASPGSANTSSTTTILSGSSSNCVLEDITNTFQIEIWFAPDAANNGFTTLVVQTANIGSIYWTEVYRYENTSYWQDQANDLVNNTAYSSTQYANSGFCSYYNTNKFTTPPINIKGSVLVNVSRKSPDGNYVLPNKIDAIYFKFNGTLYTTYNDVLAAGIRVSWLYGGNADLTETANIRNYLQNKLDCATDMRSPLTVNGYTYYVSTINMFDIFTKDNSWYTWGNNWIPSNDSGKYKEYDITNQSCLRITFPFKNDTIQWGDWT
jgi:hypothetical protein